MTFYQKFYEKDLNLTDWLAVERNLLANERNLLAYIRTFLSFSISGVGIIKIFPQYATIGYFLILTGALLFTSGFSHYKKTKEKLSGFKV
jgi:putative membrane protein